MKEYKIYTLSHPKTKEVRYIGKTYRTLKKRLSEHCSECNANHGTHKIHWIKSLKKRATDNSSGNILKIKI